MKQHNEHFFCCDALETLVNDPDDSPLQYIAYLRKFVLTIPRRYLNDPNEIALKFPISHCPRCGSTLPSSLTDEWHIFIEKKFGITGYVDQEILNTLPPEFRTDEWWKKRGL